jgi:hypothetical protein
MKKVSQKNKHKPMHVSSLNHNGNYTVTWMARALQGNGPINTPRYTNATMEQRGYATHFQATAR